MKRLLMNRAPKLITFSVFIMCFYLGLHAQQAPFEASGSPAARYYRLGADILNPSFRYDPNSASFIVDRRSLSLPLEVVTFSATPTFAGPANTTFKITLTGNVTSSTLSRGIAGQHISFLICQDATGSRTFVWPTNVKGAGVIGSTLSTCSAQTFVHDGTNAYALSAIVTGM